VKVGDLVRIKGEREVVLVTEDLSDWDQMKVLRDGALQYIRKSRLAHLEVLNESR
jgi:hypothetical protein